MIFLRASPGPTKWFNWAGEEDVWRRILMCSTGPMGTIIVNREMDASLFRY
jgi:hypothetical protein